MTERSMPNPAYTDFEAEWKQAHDAIAARLMQAHASWYKPLARRTRDTDECRYSADTLAGAAVHALRRAGLRVVRDDD